MRRTFVLLIFILVSAIFASVGVSKLFLKRYIIQHLLFRQ